MSVLKMLLENAFCDKGLVQSFSGVRTIFGAGPDISESHKLLACVYGYAYAVEICSKKEVTFILGRDPRPTGDCVTASLVKGFLMGAKARHCKLNITDLGIITTPLAQTAVRALQADGGVIVTASHNPIEHNGFKFLTGCFEIRKDCAPAGALLSASVMGEVIKKVSDICCDYKDFETFYALIPDSQVLDSLINPSNETSRVISERAYLDVIGRDWQITPHCLKPLTLGPALLDPNGGAGCGIDARVLEHFGVRVIEINAELGYPEHAIDTDGIDPASGRHMLLRVARAAARERAHFGVAFDYDADRGNLVLPGHDDSAIIPPQKVAAFNIALALARRKLNGELGKLAVVMSDATSLASLRVADAFGAEVFYVETGEINVVTKMAQLRAQGYDVPVGVEGANGGTIFETSTCRDGLQAALSAAIGESQPQICSEWVKIASKINGNGSKINQTLTLTELVNSIPFNPNVFLKMKSPDMPHSQLKANIEKYFIDNLWGSFKNIFDSYEFQNFEGTYFGKERSGDESGGWRLMLHRVDASAFVFLRGSRTEAGIWRMIVDADDESDFNALEPAAKEMFDKACGM